MDLNFGLWSRPKIDLFATLSNKKCQFFASIFWHPGTKGNALLISWSKIFAYAFPPFPLISKVMKKVKIDHCSLILIAPAWRHQYWYSKLLHLSVRPAIRLKCHPKILSRCQRQVLHHDPKTLNLTAWFLTT